MFVSGSLVILNDQQTFNRRTAGQGEAIGRYVLGWDAHLERFYESCPHALGDRMLFISFARAGQHKVWLTATRGHTLPEEHAFVAEAHPLRSAPAGIWEPILFAMTFAVGGNCAVPGWTPTERILLPTELLAAASSSTANASCTVEELLANVWGFRGHPHRPELILDHVERHIGMPGTVFREFDAPDIHVNFVHVPPSSERRFHVLVTSGMSELAMTVPAGSENFRFAELMLLLPEHWPVSEASLREPAVAWPVAWLGLLAHFPHRLHTWLAHGHVVPHYEPGEALGPDTTQSAVLVLAPISLPPEVRKLVLPSEESIHFWTIVPVYAEEAALAQRDGVRALLRRFDLLGITDVLSPSRPNAALEHGAPPRSRPRGPSWLG